MMSMEEARLCTHYRGELVSEMSEDKLKKYVEEYNKNEARTIKESKDNFARLHRYVENRKRFNVRLYTAIAVAILILCII